MMLAVFQNNSPDGIPIAFYYDVCTSEFVRLVWE